MLATVLEEMPAFAERESSILAKLKKKKPATRDVDGAEPRESKEKSRPVAQMKSAVSLGASEPKPMLQVRFQHPIYHIILFGELNQGRGVA